MTQCISGARIVAALALAPWTAPVVYTLADAMKAGGWPYHYNEFPWILAVAAVGGYLGVLLCGLPILLLLNRMGRLSLPILTACGTLFGIAAMYIFGALFAMSLGSRPVLSLDLTTLFWGVLLGAVVALSFGLIAGVPFHGRREL